MKKHFYEFKTNDLLTEKYNKFEYALYKIALNLTNDNDYYSQILLNTETPQELYKRYTFKLSATYKY